MEVMEGEVVVERLLLQVEVVDMEEEEELAWQEDREGLEVGMVKVLAHVPEEEELGLVGQYL